MKRIYLVRHGESEANVARIHGFGDSPLTSTGRAQAAYVAARVATLPIDTIISSSMTRARETAEAMAAKTGLPFLTSDLFVECMGPTEIMGKSYTDPEAVAAIAAVDGNFGPGYRFNNEENFDDLKERAQKALAYLAGLEGSHIAVATHGLFLRVLLAAAVFGTEMSARECYHCMWGFETQNTGITILEYVAEDYTGSTRKNPWRVWVYNDHAHLAD